MLCRGTRPLGLVTGRCGAPALRYRIVVFCRLARCAARLIARPIVRPIVRFVALSHRPVASLTGVVCPVARSSVPSFCISLGTGVVSRVVPGRVPESGPVLVDAGFLAVGQDGGRDEYQHVLKLVRLRVVAEQRADALYILQVGQALSAGAAALLGEA